MSRADQRVLRWFGHVERMDDYRMARRVLMVKISGGRVRGIPRLGWMDGVKVALGNRGMTVEAMRQCVESPGTYVTKRVYRGHLCLTLCFFGPPSHALVVITWSLERGGMPSQNEIGINCEKGATTENQDSAVKYMG